MEWHQLRVNPVLSRSVIVFAIALAARLCYIFFLIDYTGVPKPAHTPFGDAGIYDQLGWTLAHDGYLGFQPLISRCSKDFLMTNIFLARK